jgi:transglutaminase-like putative cysteine protease
MARITLSHTTEYTYRNPVALTRHRLMVRPDDSHDLRLHRAVLEVDPAPAAVNWKHDIFDNSIGFLEWPEELRTDHLRIVSRLDLTHHPDGQPLPRYTIDAAASSFPFIYALHEISDLAHLTTPGATDPDGQVAAWARRTVAAAGGTQTLAVLEAMTLAIQREYGYRARNELGTQTAAETIALGSGTCRDFAVLMMEALRSFSPPGSLPATSTTKP